MAGLYHPRLSDDPVLDAIDRERQSSGESSLAALLGKTFAWTVGGRTIAIDPPPPAVFGLLSHFGSPLLDMYRAATDDDLRLAGLLFVRRRLARICDPDSGREETRRFWGNAVPPREDILDIIRDAFAPYRRLPPSDHRGDGRVKIDTPFLAGLVYRVHAATGLLPEAILWQLPMAAAAAYDLEFRRYILKQHINDYPPPPEALMRRYWARVRELIQE